MIQLTHKILTLTNELISFDSNGFTRLIIICSYYDGSSYVYLAFAWKAGGNKNTFNVDDVGYASAAAAGLTGGDMPLLLVLLLEPNKGFSIIKYQGGPGNVTSSSHTDFYKTPNS